MTKILSALDIHYIIKELQFLVNARIDKIYSPRKKEIILQLFVSGKGKHSLKINENSIYLTDYKSKAETPSELCMFLRKKLDNTRLRAVRQLDFERIISLDFESKTGTISLVAELFSKGNLILLKENKILTAAEYQNWKDRTLRPNIQYKHPEKDYNFLKLKQNELNIILKLTKKENIIKTLAIDLGLGGVYSEEACLLAGIDKRIKAEDLTEKEAIKLFSILTNLKNQKPSPRIVYKNNEILDLTPFELQLYKNNKQEKAETYNQILNNYFSKFEIIKAKEKGNKQILQMQEIISQQKEDIKKLEKQEKINQEKAEKLYEQYQLVSNILKELQTISKTYSWKEIKEKLKSHKLIKEVISKDKSVVIEI